VPGALFPGVGNKAAEASSSPLLSTVEATNLWSYTSTPVFYVFIALCVTSNRNLQGTKNVVGGKRVEVAWVMGKHVYTLKMAAVCCCETVVST
jgi:ABC-type uncharacterized transport system permease subunit